MNAIGMPGAGRAEGFNVLLVTFDTTRPDHLGCYGGQSVRTPTIDSLARTGVKFENAVVTVPLTLPSHASILTGEYPYHHGIRTNTGYELKPEKTTPAERLKAANYDTAAFVSCFVLDARFGLNQGFDVYDFEASEKGERGPESVFSQRDASETSARAIAWLKKHFASKPDRPFFVWIHYYDPHHPYESPLTGDPTFKGRPYDAEIAFADAELAKVLRAIGEGGTAEKTLTVLATDHGESLGEHGENEHGIFVYEATIHGGLIFSNPELFKTPFSIKNRLVGTIDIAPTLLGMLGLPALDQVDGVDLATTVPSADRRIFVESLYPKEGRGFAPLFGLRGLKDKFILAPRSEYYDLVTDPMERTNLFSKSPVSLIPLEKEMSELLAAHPEIETAGGSIRDMTSEEMGKLSSLGYLGGVETGDTRSLPDPKDQMAYFEQIDIAMTWVKQGRVDDGLRLAQELMEKTEGFETPVHTEAHI